MSSAGPSGLRPGQFYRLAWIFYLLLAVAAVIWLGIREGSIDLSLFVEPSAVAVDLGIGIGAGLLLVGVWEAARRTLERARRLEDELRRLLGDIEATETFALALLSGIAEEIFFRGAMQAAFGWVVATVLFTLLHIGPGRAFRLWTAFAAIAGLTFAALVVWRESLLAAIVAHVVVNAVNLRRLTRDPASSAPPEVERHL